MIGYPNELRVSNSITITGDVWSLTERKKHLLGANKSTAYTFWFITLLSVLSLCKPTPTTVIYSTILIKLLYASMLPFVRFLRVKASCWMLGTRTIQMTKQVCHPQGATCIVRKTDRQTNNYNKVLTGSKMRLGIRLHEHMEENQRKV